VSNDEEDVQGPRLHAAATAAAAHARSAYLTLLVFATYVAVAVGSTTHEQLLRGSTVSLPVLNVPLPIVGFFVIVPALLVLLHFNLLLQLYLLSLPLHALRASIARLKFEPDRDLERLSLTAFSFAHAIAVRHESRVMRWLLRLVNWLTICFAPIAVLLLIQLRFLPYHSEPVTHWHRCVLVLDLIMLSLLWGRTIRPASVRARGERSTIVRIAATSTAVGFLLAVSFFLLVIPGERLELVSRSVGPSAHVEYVQHLLTRNLRVSSKTLVQEAPHPELIAAYVAARQPESVAWEVHARGLNLQGRDLRYGEFNDARFFKGDFRGARLDGANLRSADLYGADFQGASLTGADLTSAALVGANLDDAVLPYSRLQLADLSYASMQGADASGAMLGSATMIMVVLQNAKLEATNLSGADLRFANLQNAKMAAADLTQAALHGAELINADCRAASFGYARLGVTNFDRANLNLADFRFALPWRPDVEIKADDLKAGLEKWGRFDVPYGWILRGARIQHIEKVTNESRLVPSFNEIERVTTMFDQNDPLKFWKKTDPFASWGPAPAVPAYEHALVSFLSEMACARKDLAPAVVSRAASPSTMAIAVPLAQELERRKCAPAVFARSDRPGSIEVGVFPPSSGAPGSSAVLKVP